MILRIGKRRLLKSKGLACPISRLKPWAFFNQRLSTGFTFIELILVTIIILVLVGLSPSLFRNPFSSLQLKNTCQDLVQLMRYLQAKAIAERSVLRVNFDFAQGRFWATCEDEAHLGEFVKIKAKWGGTKKVPEGISISSFDSELSSDQGTPFIAFYPDGSSDKAQIKVSNNKGEAFAVRAQRKINYGEIEE